MRPTSSPRAHAGTPWWRALVSTDLEQMGSRYRPALDGYRGLFVVLVMLFHFGVTALAGGWVGINHFFTFSGFLAALTACFLLGMLDYRRQALIGLPRDGRERQAPAEAEGTVAGTGVVGERELRAESGSAGADGDGHRHGAGVGGELFADPADRAAALGE